jgi:hypothetical protein
MLLVVVAALAVFSGCRRPCEDALNCKRTCECLNTQTNSRQDCTIAFKCDGAEQVCEAEYDTMPCDELCSLYAAQALCGTERCAADVDCVKNLTCDCRDAQGNPNGRRYDCTRSFLCDLTSQTCEPLSTRSDVEICIADCPQPVECG